MKQTRKYRVFLALLASCSIFAGCSFDQETSAESQNQTEETHTSPTLTPSPTPVPTATPTEGPKESPVKYETEDEKMILYLPDASWENVSDQDGIRLFESADVGKISILHGTREELKDFTIPDSEEAVENFYKSNGVSRRDFEILEYVNNSIGDLGIYRYTVKFQEDSGFEYLYSANYVVVTGEEIYSICGTLQQEDLDLLERIQDSVESLQICQTDAMAEEEDEESLEDVPDEGNDKDGGTAKDYSEDPQFVQEDQGGDS